MAEAKKALTKPELLANLSDKTGLQRKQVESVFENLDALIRRELKAGRPFAMPGLFKIEVKIKAATAARQGRNPKTGEQMTFKAKPARKVVKLRALKALKDSVL
jgi:nucleoid DNA-binding protein